MRIVPKLTMALVLGTCVVLAVNGYFRVRRELGLFEADRLRTHRMIATSLGAAVSSVWRTEGRASALATLDAVNRSAGDVRVRWIDAPRAADLHVDAAALAATRPGEPLTKAAGVPAVWYTYVPLDVPGAPGALELADAAPVGRRFSRSVTIDSLSTALALMLSSALLAFVMGQWLVGAPVRKLADKARRTGRGDFGAPLVLDRDDEFAHLAAELNAMTSQLVSTLEQLRHADRLRTVGQLASGVAHELGTPLNVISARAAMIAAGETNEQEARDYARVVVEAADRMTRIIGQLLQFARRKGPQKAKADLRAIAEATVSLLDPLASKRGVAVELVGGSEDATANVEVGQVQQVVTNLVMNAIQSMPDGGRVEVSVARGRAVPPADIGSDPRECVSLRVADRGPGIPEEVLPHIFEPFFTTKDVGEGTGLGLAVTYGIVRDHGGWIEVESAPSEGSAFTAHFPCGSAS